MSHSISSSRDSRHPSRPCAAREQNARAAHHPHPQHHPHPASDAAERQHISERQHASERQHTSAWHQLHLRRRDDAGDERSAVHAAPAAHGSWCSCTNRPDGRRRCCIWDIVKVIAGIVLLAALSWEIIGGDHIHFSRTYLWIQFAVCLLFLCDFFLRWGMAPRRGHFFWTHLPYLLISIPWLNLLDWCGVRLTHDWGLLVGLLPMLRAFLAMTIIVAWMVREKNRLGCIFWAYIFTAVLFTYLAALLFYDYEIEVNSRLHGFGNALWWAWMNVTTVGAELFAVTGVGKVVTMLLPTLGMLFFPIFTTYILDRYTNKKEAA